MKIVLEQLKPHWRLIMLIVITHIVQAYCTLLLPTYTSGLVDTGIQNEGFEYAVPLSITQEDADILTQLMYDDERAVFQEEYTYIPQGFFNLNKQSQNKEYLKELEEVFRVPLATFQAYRQMNNRDKSQLVEEIERANQSNQTKDIRSEFVPELTAYDTPYINTMGVQGSLYLYKRTGQGTSEIQMSYLWRNGLQMLIIAIGTISSAVFAFYLAAKVGSNIGADLRSQIYNRVMTFSDHEIEQYSTASLITRTTNDITQIQNVVTVFLRAMLFAPVAAVGGILYILTIQPSMAWILAFAVILIFVFVLILFMLTLPKYNLVQTLFDRVNLIAREILSGIQVIRAFGRQDYERNRFDEANKTLQGTHMYTGRVMSLMQPFMLFILDATSIVVVWVASHRIASGSMEVGNMMAYISYSMQVLIQFLNFSLMSIMFPRALISLRRVEEVIATPSTIVDKESSTMIEDVRGVVEFDHVTFQYDDADEPTVSDISFTAKPGETTAIIGSTGSGKSTLLNLLMRFFDVTEGAIRIDGVDIRDMTQEQLHAIIGYVPQQGVLFSGTIRSNIGFGVDDLSDEATKRAADIAHASEFIEQKDADYDSYIAQGGSNVSGGQKQRLSIARAIAKNPSIYLFDDSFSALDYRTDASLRRALKKEVAGATMIIVAQRISTILDAEQIIVLDKGNIDAVGTHQELLQTSEVYQEIAKSQLSKEELEQQGDESQKNRSGSEG